MPYAKYRIEELSIEGFRGFTTPQSLSFHGKNVFVFGQNGRGKSSIVEAIRWCLFGSAAGADIEVRNTFYTNQECRVSLKLSGTTGTLRIERELRPGQERSRQIVRDSAGGEIRARDVLPQLTRLGAHDGTQVIFAAQHAAGRQINADISDFGRVLCYYLNLENVPDILKALASLLEEKQAEAEELSENIESVAAVFRDRRGALQGRIEEIVVNPPWGEGPSPTQNETIGRILTLLQELATVLDREVPDNSAPADALNLADQWIELLATRSVGDLEARIAHLSERLNQATSLMSTARSSREDLRAKERLRRKYRQQIRELLAERTIEQLRRRLQRLEHRQDLHASCAAVAEHVAQICETFALKDCPACGSAFENRELLAKARSRSKGDVAALRQSEEIQAIRDRLDSAEELNEALDGIAVEIQSESEFFDAALGDLQSSLHLEKLEKDFTQLEGHLEKIRYDLNTLRRTLNDSREEKAKRLSRSRGLR